MRRLARFLAVILSAALMAAGAAAAARTAALATPPVRAAVFDFELYDTSLEGEVRGINAAEQQRLAMISALLREGLAASDRYEVVDIAPIRDAIARAGHIRGCNGCDAALAGKLGADVAVTGLVQKVSNLILNINVTIRDVGTGAVVEAYSADIRGNTDRSWAHGVRWLLRNRLLANPPAGR